MCRFTGRIQDNGAKRYTHFLIVENRHSWGGLHGLCLRCDKFVTLSEIRVRPAPCGKLVKGYIDTVGTQLYNRILHVYISQRAPSSRNQRGETLQGVLYIRHSALYHSGPARVREPEKVDLSIVPKSGRVGTKDVWKWKYVIDLSGSDVFTGSSKLRRYKVNQLRSDCRSSTYIVQTAGNIWCIEFLLMGNLLSRDYAAIEGSMSLPLRVVM